MRVTFDTNVWNRMVFPERWRNSPNYDSLVRIKDAIRSGQVRGFISEGFATVEAIRKRNRAKFHAQNIPTVEVTPKVQGGGSISMSIEIKANHNLHPGIGEEFEEELNEALAIGIKLLTTPYIGLAVPDRLRNNLDLPPFLTQLVKTQNPMNGELSHGIVTQAVHQGVQAGRSTAAGSRGFTSRGGTWVGSQPQRAGSLAA